MNTAAAAGALLLILAAGAGVQTVTRRHQAHAERLAACATDVARARREQPARLARLERQVATGGPDGACPLAAALRDGAR